MLRFLQFRERLKNREVRSREMMGTSEMLLLVKLDEKLQDQEIWTWENG